jgi:NAD(P)-dependent dehydrogenase (short-subunit alcohol dehydrogenase family)
LTQSQPDGDASAKVLITGAGSGLGAAMARRYAAAGYSVAVTDIDRARADAVLAGLLSAGARGFSHKLDITLDSDWAAVQQRVEQEWRGLDVLINNAGVAAAGRCEESSMADWEWIVAVDLMGVVRGCHRFLPLFRRQAEQGRSSYIINIASFAGLAAMPGLSAYGTTKAGVVALSEHLLTETVGTGIGVSVVCPAFVRTGLLEDFRSPNPAHRELVERWMDKSGVTADGVADQVFTAMSRKQFLVLTHAQTRWAWWLKRLWPDRYYRQMARRFSLARRKVA